MNVFLRPIGLHSRAMVRVAEALTAYAPPDINVVDQPERADLSILHAIGPGLFERIDENQPRAVIQYCFKTAGYTLERWQEIWKGSEVVWSYYDLAPYGGDRDFSFYYAPLGVDAPFTTAKLNGQARTIGVMSSGYVSGPACEAIEEIAWAADTAGLHVVHLGPSNVVGMPEKKNNWAAVSGISDEELAQLLRTTKWVSGLRHIEGFELPVLEGLMCGARPIVFDREETREWYDGHAVFVPETVGDRLVDSLSTVLSRDPEPVTEKERARVAARFDWAQIAPAFWRRLLQ